MFGLTIAKKNRTKIARVSDGITTSVIGVSKELIKSSKKSMDC
jgi:hypothetical protein